MSGWSEEEYCSKIDREFKASNGGAEFSYRKELLRRRRKRKKSVLLDGTKQNDEGGIQAEGRNVDENEGRRAILVFNIFPRFPPFSRHPFNFRFAGKCCAS